MNKKGLGPIIAISLLVIVSVVAVIGFQSWYEGYESKTFSDVEIKSSNSKGTFDIQYISNEGKIYILNTLKDNYKIYSIKINDLDCNINENLSLGINNFSVKICLNSSGVQDIVIFGEKKIVEKKLYLDTSNFNLTIPYVSLYSVPSDNLFAFYTFDNISGTNLYEEIGDYHGVMYNTPTQVTGKYGQALKFDSTQTEYVLLPDAIGNPLTNDYSISFWVYYDAGNAGLVFRTSVVSGVQSVHTTNGYRWSSGWRSISTGGHILNEWNHLVMIKSSVNGTIIYLNGVLTNQNIAQTENTVGEADKDENYFGRDVVWSSFLNGTIDNFRIYTKELNETEILGLYYE